MNITRLQPQLIEWRAQGYTMACLEYKADSNFYFYQSEWCLRRSETEAVDWHGESEPIENYIRAELEADLRDDPPPPDSELNEYEGTLWIDLEKQEIEHEYQARYEIYGEAKTKKRALS